MLYNAFDAMTRGSDIRALLACPSCGGDDLRWEASSVSCATCGETFALVGDTPLLLPRQDAPERSDEDRSLMEALPVCARSLAMRARPVVRPLLTHRSKARRELTPRFVRLFPSPATILNVGAGGTDYGANVVNLDIAPAPGIDVVGVAEALPFRDGSFDAVVFQAVLEHVRDASKALSEIARVLRAGGAVLVEVPFMQGYHAAPGDYRRFTVSGLREELGQHGFTVTDSGVAVGPASAMAWISAEYLALLLSGRSGRVYRVARILTTWLAWPVKWTDAWLDGHEMAHVVASGVWAQGTKVSPEG